eukprot:g7772.t1
MDDMTTELKAQGPDRERQRHILTNEMEGNEMEAYLELPPDHALLQKAQDSLRSQLLEIKQDLFERLREKQRTLKDAEAKRQATGVELYGFQERLAEIHKALERAVTETSSANKTRLEVCTAHLLTHIPHLQTEHTLTNARLKTKHQEDQTALYRRKANAAQRDLDELNAALKQVEQYNEDAKNELRVTKRETEATEDVIKQIGKEKDEQDFLIVDLQNTLKQREEEQKTLVGKLEAQGRERNTAEEILAQAYRDMENVHFEKQQLLSVWRSTLVQLQRKDETLNKTRNSIEAQNQTKQELDLRMSGCKKELQNQQVRNEETKLVINRVEEEARAAGQKLTEMELERQQLKEALDEIQSNMRQIDEKLELADSNNIQLLSESENCQKQYLKASPSKICKDTQDLREVLLTAMNEQTASQRSSGKAETDLKRLIKENNDKEIAAATIRNEIANLQANNNSFSHNLQLQDTLESLEEELNNKSEMLQQMETESRQKEGEIDKQTRELDSLNRKYQQLTANMEDESTGPLEATINNLRREIQNKESESHELQRRWMNKQLEFVKLENNNTKLRESLSMMQSKTTVMKQKKRRLEAQLDQNNTSLKMLRTSMGRLHRDIQSLNVIIAKNEEWSKALANRNYAMENELIIELKALESEVRKTEDTIENSTYEKRSLLAEIVETEKEIMVLERKLELEKELQATLGSESEKDSLDLMKKEIHRLELKLGQLMRHQEQLIRDLETGIQKRQNIRYKKEAIFQKTSGDLTESKLKKNCTEIKRSIQATQKETNATESRVALLKDKRAELVTDLDNVRRLLNDERDRQDDIEIRIEEARSAKNLALIETVVYQKMTKKFEDVLNGKFRAPLQKLDTVSHESEKAVTKFHLIQRILKRHSVSTTASFVMQSIAQQTALNRLYDKI